MKSFTFTHKGKELTSRKRCIAAHKKENFKISSFNKNNSIIKIILLFVLVCKCKKKSIRYNQKKNAF